MKNFTEDLLIEILSWLPVISLVRFRHRKDDVDVFMSLSRESLDVITEDLGFQYFDTSYEIVLEFCGGFNGIVCLYDECHKNIIFWNPALRHIKILPKPSFVAPPNASCCAVPEVGFGFDFKTNDFKLVMIHRLFIDIGNCDQLRSLKTEVYSLSTDSWRLIDAVFPDGLYFQPYHHSRICVKGVDSRLTHTLDMANELIHFSLLTFNMTDEVFVLTPMPREVYTFRGDDLFFKALTELNGSVAYITYEPPLMRVKSLEISVLDEYGPNGIWTKLYTIGPLFDIFHPLGFWKNDELFCETYNHELALCDPVTNELKKTHDQCTILVWPFQY